MISQGDLMRGDTKAIGKQGRILLIVGTLFVAASALSNTLVNIYLWKVKNDYAMIGWFNLATFVATAISFFFMGKIVKQYNSMISLRLGVAISALFYLSVLYLGKSSVDYVIALGMLQGIGSGFYWLAFNVIYFEITSRENRDRFNGLNGFFGSGVGMIAPLLAGWIITLMPDAVGYRIIFAASLSIFTIAVAISFFLKCRKSDGEYELLALIKGLKRRKDPWYWIVPGMFFQGLREGVSIFLVGLLVYIVSENELKLGIFTLVVSAVALFSYYAVGRWLKPKWRLRGMLIGAIMISVVIFPLFLKINMTTLVISGIGTSLFLPLFLIPLTSTVFDSIGRTKHTVEHRVEYVVLRELALNGGRVASVLLFIGAIQLSTSPVVFTSLLFFVAVTQILTWYFVKNISQAIFSEK